MQQQDVFTVEAILTEMGLTIDDMCVVLNEIDHENEIFQIVHKGTATDCLNFVSDNTGACTHMTSEEDFISRGPKLIEPS